MKAILLTVFVVASLSLAGVAAAAGCHGGGGGEGGGCGMAAAESLPPAENMLTLTGTVVSIAPNGAALVDTGEAQVYVMAPPAPPAEDGTAAPSPFKVGDAIQVQGVLLALTVEPVATDAEAAAAGLQQARFKVENILCGACSAAVKKALTAAPGVKQAAVGGDGTASVEFDAAATTPEALIKVITGAKHPHAGMKFGAKLLQ